MKMNNFKDNEFSLRYCLFNKINGCKKKQIKSREKSAKSNSCAIQAWNFCNEKQANDILIEI